MSGSSRKILRALRRSDMNVYALSSYVENAPLELIRFRGAFYDLCRPLIYLRAGTHGRVTRGK